MHLIGRELSFKNTKLFSLPWTVAAGKMGNCWVFQNWKPFRVSIVGVPATSWKRLGRARWTMADMVIEVESMVFVQNLGGRQMLRLVKEGILVCVMMVVVAAGVVFFGKCFLLEIEVEYSGVGFISGSWHLQVG